MIRNILILLSLVVCSFAAKQSSVFGAGDINSPKPYGLNSTQKQVVKNKNATESLIIDMNYIKNDINKLKDSIEGISSVIEDNSNRLNDPNEKNHKSKNSLLIQENQSSIENIKNVLQKILDEQAKIQTDQAEILSQLKAMSENQTNQAKTKDKKPIKKNTKKMDKKNNKSTKNRKTEKTTLGKEKNKDKKLLEEKTKIDKKALAKTKVQQFKEAKRLYKKEYYTKAIPIFENLVDIKYKPSESTYHLGHMWFVRKKYSKALSYFKKSATMHDKGWWMPKLLLYSAVSFEKINDLDNAANFYSSLIEIYPNTKEAKIAKKNIGE